MLMCPEVVHDAAAFFAVDHVRVKPALFPGGKGPDPSHGLTAQGIAVSIVLNREGHVPALFWKHDASPRAHIQERQSIWCTVPDTFHYLGPDSCRAAFRSESKTPLNLGMQPREIRTKSSLVDRNHAWLLGLTRRH